MRYIKFINARNVGGNGNELDSAHAWHCYGISLVEADMEHRRLSDRNRRREVNKWNGSWKTVDG